jgi:peptidyl-prolyl cis-trans isomerase B (cyclophilin B)
VAHAPQPHLEGRYTVFGEVVQGMDVVDRLSRWDVIRSVRVWDGKAWIGQ